MYVLNRSSTQCVSGGYSVYITDHSKNSDAHFTGLAFGYGMGTFGLLIATSPNMLGFWGIGAAAVIGLAGYGMGYTLTQAYYAKYASNNWYEFPDPIHVYT